MNIKKIIVLMTLIFVCCIFGNAHAAELPKAEQDAVDTLKSVGVIDEYTPASSITRGEFADVLAKVLVKDTSIYSEKKYFIDVPSDYKYANEINKLTSYGCILGDHESRFHPQNNISTAEASALIVRLLGYDVEVQNKGGAMEDYVMEAAGLGVLDNVSAADAALSKGNAMIMISNAFEVDLMALKNNGLNNSYEVKKNKTLLSEYMGIYLIKDILSAAGNASISNTVIAGDNCITVGDVVMEVAEEKMPHLRDSIGKYVKAYYQNESGGPNVLVGLTEQRKNGANDDVVIKLDDLTSVSETSVSYNTGNKQKTLRFKKDAYIMYNNRAADVYDLNTLIGKTGTITFTDPLGSGYNVIKIDVYDEYVVSEVIAEKGTILDKYHTAAALIDLNENDIEYEVVDFDGNTKSLSDITKGNVLSVQTSLDGNYRRIVISTVVAEGKIQSVTNGGEPEVTIDGKEYRLSASYAKYNDSYLLTGIKATAYLNIFGEIAGIDMDNNSDYIVGILTNVYFYNEKGEFSPTLKIFSADSAFHNYEMKVNSKDKVKVNGKNISEDELRSILNMSGDTPEMIPIRYKLNLETEISELEYDDSTNDGDRDGIRRLGRDITDKQYYRKNALSFGGLVSIKSDAVVFVCPTDKNDTNDFGITTISYFTNDGSYNMDNIYVMATSKEDYAGSVVMVKRNPTSVVSNSNLAVVLNIMKAVNDDNDIVQQLTLLSNGKEITIQTKSGLSWDCENGDAIQYRTNNSDELIVLEKWASCEKNSVTISSSSGLSWHAQGRVMYAVPEEIKNGVAKLTLYNGSEIVGTEYHLLTSFTCYEVDFAKSHRRGRVSLADPSAIKARNTNPDDYSKLVLQTSYGDGKNLVIYNNWVQNDIQGGIE